MLKKIAVIVFAAYTGISLNAAPALMVENRYGATISLMINKSSEKRVNDGEKVDLGPLNKIIYLAIRTTGMGSGYGASPYTDLAQYLKQVGVYYAHPQKNPVLVINRSSYLSPWNITIEWQSSTDLISSFDMSDAYVNFFLGHTSEEKIKGIMGGALGREYAQKTYEICSTSYAQASKLGKIDLCENLRRNVVAPEYRIDPRKPGIGPNSPEMQPLIEEIKETIDRLYRALQNYRKNGWVI